MPRKAEGELPLTTAERQARRRERKARQTERMRHALEQIAASSRDTKSRETAAEALKEQTR